GTATDRAASSARLRFISRLLRFDLRALLCSLRALLGGSRRARNGADDRPVVFVHEDRAFRFRPQFEREVIVTVAKDARLDGQVAHALAKALLAPDCAAFND